VLLDKAETLRKMYRRRKINVNRLNSILFDREMLAFFLILSTSLVVIIFYLLEFSYYFNIILIFFIVCNAFYLFYLGKRRNKTLEKINNISKVKKENYDFFVNSNINLLFDELKRTDLENINDSLAKDIINCKKEFINNNNDVKSIDFLMNEVVILEDSTKERESVFIVNE
tara:strand:+ start:29770 stop:30282 length:513 start_codon:yes stop_codon:yes gene_type:complete